MSVEDDIKETLVKYFGDDTKILALKERIASEPSDFSYDYIVLIKYGKDYSIYKFSYADKNIYNVEPTCLYACPRGLAKTLKYFMELDLTRLPFKKYKTDIY